MQPLKGPEDPVEIGSIGAIGTVDFYFGLLFAAILERV